MVRVIIAFALCALATASAALQAQSESEVAGCYRFSAQLFTWTVGEAWSGTVYSAQSSIVELRTERLEDSVQPAPFFRIIAPGMRDSSAMQTWYRYSGWRRIGPDSVTISWWSGLSGHSLSMTMSGDSLIGTRVYLSDLDFGDRRATERRVPTVARRMPCPSPPR